MLSIISSIEKLGQKKLKMQFDSTEEIDDADYILLKLYDDSFKAVKKNKASYTINIICGLIEAQNNFKGDWCLVWKSTDKVRKNTRLKIDLADAAIKNIFEYMDLYKDECK